MNRLVVHLRASSFYYSSSNFNCQFSISRRFGRNYDGVIIPAFAYRRSSSSSTDGKNGGVTPPAPPSSYGSSLPVKSDDVSSLQKNSSRDNTAINSEILQRLYEIAKPERYLIIASAGTLAVTSSITLILPYACGNVLDAAILEATTPGSGDQFSPFSIALGLFGLTGAAGLGVYARSLMLNIAGNRIVSRIRRRLFASILSQETSFFDQTKSGDLMSRLSNDAWFIKGAMTTEAVAGMRGLVMSTGATSLLFYSSPKLAMVSLLSLPPVFLMARVVGRQLKVKQKEVQALHGEAASAAEEALGAIKTVQLFNAERIEHGRYSTSVIDAHDKEIEVGRTKAAFDGLVHVAANGAVLLVMGYGGTLVLGGELTPGELTGFLMYSLLMAGNVSSLSGTYTEIIKSIAATGRVFDIIDRVPQIPSYLHKKTTESTTDEANGFNPFVQGDNKGSISIKFDRVKFAYPMRSDVPVLADFTLDIMAGENIALVGGSGSGKSTCASLLARLYNLDEGSIYLNDQDIIDIDPAIVREQIGVVAQEPLLFFGSILENIRYGRPDASDKEVSTQN